MTPEEEEELIALREENETLKNQAAMSDFPASETLMSEKNFALLAGKDEIPDRYKDVFDYMLTPSMQWMLITSKEEEEYWLQKCLHSFDAYVMTHPHCGYTYFDRQQVEILVQKRLNKANGGFDRTMIVTSIQEMNYQSTPMVPKVEKKESLFQKLNPFRR